MQQLTLTSAEHYNQGMESSPNAYLILLSRFGDARISAAATNTLARGDAYALVQGTNMIGREVHPDVAIALSCRSVSRRHAHIELNERYVWELTDVSSRNGTWLNGRILQPYTPADLSEGDRIGIGICGFELIFTFQIEAYALPTQTYEEFLAEDDFSNWPLS